MFSQLSHSPKETNFGAIIEKYDNFIIDIYGVLHNGICGYEGVEKSIESLTAQKKNFVFLSNAPRPAKVIHERLEKINLNIPEGRIYTSGDFFLESLKEERFLGKKFYLAAPENNADLASEMKVDITDNMEEADFIILMMFCDDHNKISEYEKILLDAAKYKIEALCPNPDKIVMNGDKVRYTAGYFANKYSTEFGCKVTYFGKPHPNIYQSIFNKFDFLGNRTIAIGDSLETDILGAQNISIDSALVRTGIHSNEKKLDNLFNRLNISPTYIINSFGI